MKAMSLVLTAMMVSSMAQARGGSDVGTGSSPLSIRCELIELTASTKVAERYNMKFSEFKMEFNQDGEFDRTIGKYDILAYEDDTLKGLYDLSLIAGKAPMVDDDGAAARVLLKKSEVLTAADWKDLADSTLTGLEAKTAKVQTYAVVHDMNLAGMASVSLTNKLKRAIVEENKALPDAQKIRIYSQVQLIDGVTLLGNPVVKKIIQSKFKQGEPLMVGINHACISDL